MALDPKKLEEWKRTHGTTARYVAGDARTLIDAVPALIAEVERLRALLREVQWAATTTDGEAGSVTACPVCGGYRTGTPIVNGVYLGHTPDCRLAAELRE